MGQDPLDEARNWSWSLTQRKKEISEEAKIRPIAHTADSVRHPLGYLCTILTACMAPCSNAAEIGAALKAQGCPTCHHETRAGVGPSFKAMATRRCVDTRAASTHFASKLRNGVGHPKTTMTDEQLAQLSNWICSLRQD